MTTRFPVPAFAGAMVAFALAAAPSVEAQARADSAATADAEVSRDATVYVANNHWLDLRVYAVASGRVHRLGYVTSLSTAQFKLPRSFVASALDVRLVAYPIGSRARVTTPVLLVTPGSVIEWHVENNLRLSNASVW